MSLTCFGAARQRGAAALGTVLILVVAAALGALAWSRSSWIEQRGTAAQWRAALADETAQAGLDRAWAWLNDARAIDVRCLPAQDEGGPRAAASGGGDAVTGSSLLGRWLAAADAGAATARAGGTVTGPAAEGTSAGFLPAGSMSCARTAAGWDCRCAAAAPPSAEPAADDPPGGLSAAWHVQGELDARALPWPVLRMTSTGCAEGGWACVQAASSGQPHRPTAAAARVRSDFLLRPALVETPAAGLVAGRAIRLGPGVVVRNPDPAAFGIAVHAGGAVDAGAARVHGLPGTPRAAAIVEHDPALASAAAVRFHDRWLGTALSDWRRLPRVARLRCGEGDCAADLDRLVTQGHRLVAVEGPLRWQPPAAARAGEAPPPIVLVVDGRLDLVGPGAFDGVLIAREIHADHAGPAPLRLRGTLVAEQDATLTGAVTLERDAHVVQLAARQIAAAARIAGSWHDLPLP